MAAVSRRQTLIGALSSLLIVDHQALGAESAKITFVLANDVYEISPQEGRGGLAKLAAIVKAERRSGGNVIFTHGGDTLSPSLISGFDQGQHMIELFNLMTLDAFVPGNHEFDFGEEVYRQRMQQAKFPIVAANLRDANNAPLPNHHDFIRFEQSGIKFAIVGATLDYSSKISSPGSLKIDPTVDTIITQANALKNQGVDVVIALIHADKMMGQQLLNSHQVDLIFTGHNHDLHIDYDGQSALAESNEDAKYTVCIDAEFAIRGEGTKRHIVWSPHFRVIDSIEVEPDPEMNAYITKKEAELSQQLDVTVATLLSDLDSHEALVRTQETAIGNLFADALRVQNHADIALINGGGIRGDTSYEAGSKILRRDILKELPFGNRSVIVQISGKDLISAFENGFSLIEVAAGRFPQISGMRVSVDRKAKVGSRVVAVEFNGKKITEDQKFRLATNDYLAKGGDGYTILKTLNFNAPDQGNILMANDVMVYCQNLRQIDAKVENRIIFLN